MRSVVATLRLPDYPAWVRRWCMPSDRLVAVYAAGRIVSACAELKACGVVPGDRLERARALVPAATFHEHDPHLDAGTWEEVLAVLSDISPHLRPLREGTVTLAPFDLDALAELNRTLGGLLGVAHTTLLAGVAAMNAVPGTALRVEPHQEEEFLARASVRCLAELGCDPETVQRLGLFGLTTVARLMQLTRRHLFAQFGAHGAALYDLLHSRVTADSIPLYQPPPCVTAAYAFEHPACEPHELIPVLDHLLKQAAEQLGAVGARMLTLRLDGDGTHSARRPLKSATADIRQLRAAAVPLLNGIMRRRIDVRTMTVRLGALAERGGVQAGLFANRPELANVVGKLHRRFPGRLLRAVVVDRDAYLPERAVRFEPFPVQTQQSVHRHSPQR